MFVCVCVFVCVFERERERERGILNKISCFIIVYFKLTICSLDLRVLSIKTGDRDIEIFFVFERERDFEKRERERNFENRILWDLVVVPQILLKSQLRRNRRRVVRADRT